MEQKPGCIHPGDPEGCIGSFMVILGLIVIAILIMVTGMFGSSATSADDIPATTTTGTINYVSSP